MHLTVATIFALCVTRTLALPGGAPATACTNLTPNHSGNQAQANPSTYMVDLSNFPNGTGGEVAYMPGATYTVTIRATGNTFRGFLIQARNLSESPVGMFSIPSAPSGVAELSACTPPDSAVTHSNRNDKTMVELMWTAPSGSETIRFHLTTVQTFTTFWVNETTGNIQALAAAQPTTTMTPSTAITNSPTVTNVATPTTTAVVATPTITTVATPTITTAVPTITTTTAVVATPTNTPTATPTMVVDGSSAATACSVWATISLTLIVALKNLL